MVKDREVWHVVVHGIAKSWIQLSDWTEQQQQPVITKAIATPKHKSTLTFIHIDSISQH